MQWGSTGSDRGGYAPLEDRLDGLRPNNDGVKKIPVGRAGGYWVDQKA